MNLEELVLIVVGVFLILGVLERFKIGSVILALMGKQKNPQREDEVDMLGEIIKGKKLIAMNMKKRRGFGKYILFVGDEDIPRKREKYVGVIPDTTCTLFFIKPAWYRQSRPFIVPTVLVTDLQRKYIRIRSRGMDRWAKQFFGPIFTNDVNEEQRHHFGVLINEYIYEFINREASLEAQSLRLNSVATNSKTSHYDQELLAFRDKNKVKGDELVPEDEGGD